MSATTLPQSDLPRDAGILRTAAQHNRANVGVYASVLQGDKVRRGDSVSLEQGPLLERAVSATERPVILH